MRASPPAPHRSSLAEEERRERRSRKKRSKEKGKQREEQREGEGESEGEGEGEGEDEEERRNFAAILAMLTAVDVSSAAATVVVGEGAAMGDERGSNSGGREGETPLSSFPSPSLSTAMMMGGALLGSEDEARRGETESREREAQRRRREENSEVLRYLPWLAGAFSPDDLVLPRDDPSPPTSQRPSSSSSAAVATPIFSTSSAAVATPMFSTSSAAVARPTGAPSLPPLFPYPPSLSSEGATTTTTTRTAMAVGECLVCMDCDATHALVPCGHIVACAACIGALRECPLCRASVDSTLKIFLPHGGAAADLNIAEAMTEIAGIDEEGRDYVVVKGRRFYATP